LLERALSFIQGRIVNRRLSNISSRTSAGSCAFVRVVAMAFAVADDGYPHAPRLAILTRTEVVRQMEDRWHPGEGSV
jgi:hypothetical protein